MRALGDEFHRYLVKRADNTKLLQVLEQMREEVQPVRTMSIVAPGRAPALVREHLAIIDALKRPTGGAPSGSCDCTSGVFATPSFDWSTEAAIDRGGTYG